MNNKSGRKSGSINPAGNWFKAIVLVAREQIQVSDCAENFLCAVTNWCDTRNLYGSTINRQDDRPERRLAAKGTSQQSDLPAQHGRLPWTWQACTHSLSNFSCCSPRKSAVGPNNSLKEGSSNDARSWTVNTKDPSRESPKHWWNRL